MKKGKSCFFLTALILTVILYLFLPFTFLPDKQKLHIQETAIRRIFCRASPDAWKTAVFYIGVGNKFGIAEKNGVNVSEKPGNPPEELLQHLSDFPSTFMSLRSLNTNSPGKFSDQQEKYRTVTMVVTVKRISVGRVICHISSSGGPNEACGETLHFYLTPLGWKTVLSTKNWVS